mgnify:CR=1 FL=1
MKNTGPRLRELNWNLRIMLFILFVVVVDGSMIGQVHITFEESLNIAFSSERGVLALAFIVFALYSKLYLADMFLIAGFNMLGIWQISVQGYSMTEVHMGAVIAIVILAIIKIMEEFKGMFPGGKGS